MEKCLVKPDMNALEGLFYYSHLALGDTLLHKLKLRSTRKSAMAGSILSFYPNQAVGFINTLIRFIRRGSTDTIVNKKFS